MPTLTVRVTEAERTELQAIAEAYGYQSLSDYVRVWLKLKPNKPRMFQGKPVKSHNTTMTPRVEKRLEEIRTEMANAPPKGFDW